jgi:hypothetical protein
VCHSSREREKRKETKGSRNSRRARAREVSQDDVDSGSTKTITKDGKTTHREINEKRETYD